MQSKPETNRQVATLEVHEALSKKVGLETLGTAVLPQLWTMSMVRFRERMKMADACSVPGSKRCPVWAVYARDSRNWLKGRARAYVVGALGFADLQIWPT